MTRDTNHVGCAFAVGLALNITFVIVMVTHDLRAARRAKRVLRLSSSGTVQAHAP